MRQEAEVDGNVSFKSFDLQGLCLKNKKKKNYETANGYVICAFSRIVCALPFSLTK
jgi:hypothetical protein